MRDRGGDGAHGHLTLSGATPGTRYGQGSAARALWLARALLAGEWDERALVKRARGALHQRPPWLAELTREVISAYPRAPTDRPRGLANRINALLAAMPPSKQTEPTYPRPRRWHTQNPAMAPGRWPVPPITTTGELAGRLGCSDGELAWLADARGLERTAQDQRLRNYHYATIERPGRAPRVIERPKHRLKSAQRKVLHEILDWIPAHDAAHGFTPGRSVVSHALVHSGSYVVVRIDLQDFFASIQAGRVYGIFRTAGYPEAVAHTLTALATNSVSADFWHSLPRPQDPAQLPAHHRLGRQLATAHLPQGAPSSPALANLAAFGLDRCLAGLARSLEASYTRYADDLTFSGSQRLVRQATLLRRAVADIARDEGFSVNEAKSTLVTQAGRQRVCGVVVNRHPNLGRDEYDLLKAILHNAALHKPASQNREQVPDFRAHLLGRISWIAALNGARGARLRRQFALIDWNR
ncbi:MAG: reverse transcriptase family protein [Solirubrobacteraceae bacterium]